MHGRTTALTVRVTEHFIPTLLRWGRVVLDANSNNPLGHWVGCVRVVPREMPLIPPEYDATALRVVCDALLAGKRSPPSTAPA
jgi:hypothetical protein